MGVLTNDEFFAQLAQLFDATKGKDHGSIFLVQKRLSYDQPLPDAPQDGAFPDTSPASPLPILIRATNGKSKDRKTKRVKLSTVVTPDALPSFFDKYSDVCKAGMTTLKPRDRSKNKRKAKKKKGGAAA
ncbi:signal recognition particle 14kD protein [Microdochium bolleyi]|uniref:Signal recognition particle subunit SRP14 n=1 Tax=Microdochium bolleyi TaxID=196109 RepID=A0A136J0J2_9PEZI|nr:signal recognition particle 14kD protein [Microdochium bolleyi]